MSNLYNFLTDDTMKIPPCITVMDPDLLEYVPGQHLTLSFPVKNFYLNGGNVMQGGFIGAAFDNVFGIFVFLEKQHVNMSTIDLQINYHHPLLPEDKLVIKAYLKHSGKTIVHINAEGFNKDGVLAATASTNIILR
ncbi:MAG: PaaI family thioesterase [Peptococcia bacterium]